MFSLLAIVPFVAAMAGVGVLVTWPLRRREGKLSLRKIQNALDDTRSKTSPGEAFQTVKRSTSRDPRGIEFALDRLGQRSNH